MEEGASNTNHEHDERVDEAIAIYLQRLDLGEQIDPAEFVKQYPDLDLERSLHQFIQCLHAAKQVAQVAVEGNPDDETGRDVPFVDPSTIGRYQIHRKLGEGGFGRVYLAHDPQLQRDVAIKMPGRRRLNSAGRIEAFLQRRAPPRDLKHPGLVAVYDVQQDADQVYQVYVVQEFIDGTGSLRLEAGSRTHRRARSSRCSRRWSTPLASRISTTSCIGI